jgi:3-deoxy-D-manno-octulosonic-acid transferase
VLFFLYYFAWTLILIFMIPLILFAMDRRFHDRLGLSLPNILPEKKRIWIHALSVGEVISAQPLIKLLRDKYPSRDIALTIKTSQGMKVARDQLAGEVDVLLPMPLDFWWSVGRISRCVRPSILILVETDIWPGLIYYLKRRSIKAILVNGRISPRTFHIYRRFRFFSRQVLNIIDQYLMQSDMDSKRLLEIGLPENKVKTIGNMKFDRSWSPMDKRERETWVDLLGLKTEDRLWVAGSTHAGEDVIVLETFKHLREYFPELRLIIAPRRIEQSDEILGLCGNRGLRVLRRTDSNRDGYPWQVLILNTIGELERVYGLADVSFVGGSMVPVGGHNLLEPASFGCPVLFGMYTHNFVQMARLLIEAGGGQRVKDKDELFLWIKRLLSDSDQLDRMAIGAKAFVERNRGALGRVMENIGGYFGSS